MTEDQFWQLIADSREHFDPARRDGNMDRQTEWTERPMGGDG